MLRQRDIWDGSSLIIWSDASIASGIGALDPPKHQKKNGSVFKAIFQLQEQPREKGAPAPNSGAD